MKRAGKLAGKLALGASAALVAFSLPSAVLAIGLLENGTFSAPESPASFTPASVDPDLAQLVAERSGGKARMMRFTPAGAATANGGRSVTVAVRIDQQTAEAFAARSTIASRDSAESRLRVTPTRYNLGLARGYSSFAQAPALSTSLSNAQIPDLSDFEPSTGVREEPSRFAARVELEQDQRAGRAEEARESVGDQMLDVAGSYRLTRNLDITAGLRYEQDRDLVPLPDLEQQDSQAVYIGTQFRF